MKCIFMGTPEIAATLLKNMLNANIHVDLVVTQPDKKKGRKQILVYSPVKEVAVANDIPVFQPVHIKDDYQQIIDCQPDVIVTCAYGQIVPQQVLDAPTFGCVNLHGSLLPKYRGGAPIQRAIWDGCKESGMSLMKMAFKMDAGPVLAYKRIHILPEDNCTSVFEKMGIAASELLIDKWDEIISGKAQYIEQDETKVTYAPVIKKEEEKIDLSQSDEKICDQIRALSYQPGGYVMIKGKKFKILKATYQKVNVSLPFQILGLFEDGYGITLKDGILYVQECQMEGKPMMKAKDFYNGQGRNLVSTMIE